VENVIEVQIYLVLLFGGTAHFSLSTHYKLFTFPSQAGRQEEGGDLAGGFTGPAASFEKIEKKWC
jgi:hypothetical protein